MLILDRYILKSFISTLVFSIIALCAIFLVVNLLENLDDFIDAGTSFMILVDYYINFFPQILEILTPVATLLATLFTVGRLSTLNEVTAMKSGGLSLYRLMLPLLVFSMLFSFVQLYFNGWIVPISNKKKLEIEQVYLNKNKKGSAIYNFYFRDTPTKHLLLNYYNDLRFTGSNAAIEEYTSEETPRLVSRTESTTIKWDTINSKWLLIDGIIRDYDGLAVKVETFDSLYVDININHEQLVKLKKTTDEMNLTELKEYIQLLKQGGKNIRKQLIDYYAEFAFPFANFIVVLFGVPFASVRKKGGIAIQIGAAMVISFVYMIFIKFSQTIGYSYDLNPIIVAWFANSIFFVAGLITVFKTKT